MKIEISPSELHVLLVEQGKKVEYAASTLAMYANAPQTDSVITALDDEIKRFKELFQIRLANGLKTRG